MARSSTLLPFASHPSTRTFLGSHHRGYRAIQLGRRTKFTQKGISLRLDTTICNAAHETLGHYLSEPGNRTGDLVRIIYECGSLVGILGMIGGVAYMIWTAGQIAYPMFGGVNTSPASELGVTPPLIRRSFAIRESTAPADNLTPRPIIPGLTVPFSDLPIILVALLWCQVVHEAGHAIAAAVDAIPMLSAGLSFVLVIPMAFVALPSTYSSSTSFDTPFSRARRQLRVATSGAWNNLLLYMLVAFVSWTAIFENGGFWVGRGYGLWKNTLSKGIVVENVMSDSPLRNHIPISSIITRLDDVFLAKSKMDTPTWYEYLAKASSPEDMDGWCVSRAWFKSQPSKCCNPQDSGDSVGLCFVPPSLSLSPSASQGKTAGNGRCIDPVSLFTSVSEVNTATRCHAVCMTSPGREHAPLPGEEETCVRPRKDVDLLRITLELPDWEPSHEGKRTKTIVWNGPHQEVLEQVVVGQLQPRFWWVPARLPSWGTLWVNYTQIITLSLFVINLLPISVLDGGQVLSALLDALATPPSHDHQLLDLDRLEGGESAGPIERGNSLNGRKWKTQVELITSIGTSCLLAFVCLGSTWKEFAR